MAVVVVRLDCGGGVDVDMVVVVGDDLVVGGGSGFVLLTCGVVVSGAGVVVGCYWLLVPCVGGGPDVIYVLVVGDVVDGLVVLVLDVFVVDVGVVVVF